MQGSTIEAAWTSKVHPRRHAQVLQDQDQARASPNGNMFVGCIKLAASPIAVDTF